MKMSILNEMSHTNAHNTHMENCVNFITKSEILRFKLVSKFFLFLINIVTVTCTCFFVVVR